jgi:hypothetical protein
MVEVKQRPREFIKQSTVDSKIQFNKIQEPVTTVPYLKHILISIRNHYMIGAPVVILRFLCSVQPEFITRWISQGFAESVHKFTDWALCAVALLLVAEKMYLVTKNVQRPPIPNSTVRFLVRNHWAVFSSVLFLIVSGRPIAESLGFKNTNAFNLIVDTLLLGAVVGLAFSKTYILTNRIETVRSQFNPTVIGNKEKSD